MSRLIKGSDIASGAASVVFGDLSELGDNFNALRPSFGRAAADADLELPMVDEDVLEARALAEASGFEAGRQQGLSDVAKDVSAISKIFNGLKKEADNLEARCISKTIDLIELVLISVCRVSEPDGRRLIESIKSSMGEIRGDKDCSVRLNPVDIEVLLELGFDAESSAVKMVSDESIGRGGYVLSDEYTNIDARVERRIKKIISTINEAH